MNRLSDPLGSLAFDSRHLRILAEDGRIPSPSYWPMTAVLLWLAPALVNAHPSEDSSHREQTHLTTAVSSGAQDSAGQPRSDLAIGDVTATQYGQRLRLNWPASAGERQEIRLPRLAATVCSCQWSSGAGPEIGVVPEPTEWLVRWTGPAPADAAIDMLLESEPLRVSQVPPISPTADGSVWLPAHLAATHGKNLRFEPQPFKNTIGYWTLAEDHAVWSFAVDRPGQYSVAVLQGCGAGQGGSDARIDIFCESSLVVSQEFTVEETGHFQNFEWRTLGLVHLDTPGSYQLKLSAQRIARAAVGDFRAIHLVRQAQPR